MATLLDGLKRHTVVVARTGDSEVIARLRPGEATTNPSLILGAVNEPVNQPTTAKGESAAEALDRVLVAFDLEILRRIDGRVATKVDARRSCDMATTICKAWRLIAHCGAPGIAHDGVVSSIAATWEGVRSAEDVIATEKIAEAIRALATSALTMEHRLARLH